MRFLRLAIAVAVVAGASYLAAPRLGALPFAPETWRAEYAVRLQMRDPRAVSFRNVADVGGGRICGGVGLRNSLGGWVDLQGFAYNTATGVADVFSLSDRTDYDVMCHGHAP